MKYTFIFSLQISSFTYHVIKQWYHFVDHVCCQCMEHSAECCEKLAHFQFNVPVKMDNGGINSFVAFVCFLQVICEASPPPLPQ